MEENVDDEDGVELRALGARGSAEWRLWNAGVK